MTNFVDTGPRENERREMWRAALSQNLTKPAAQGLGEPAAWFLGPSAENKDLLEQLIKMAIDSHCEYRKNYSRLHGDPDVITDGVKQSQSYKDAKLTLIQQAADLNKMLARSAPIASMRSHGHMLWDQVLPAMVGYFAGMLYNQNNVAAEASPVTTELEIEVCKELCDMVGYKVDDSDDSDPRPVSWGHIACDGSVANIEALWAARNVKFYGVAMRAALKQEPLLRPARDITVKSLSGSSDELVGLDTWNLLNLPIDELVALPERVVEWANRKSEKEMLTKEKLNELLEGYALPNIGMIDFYQRYMMGSVQSPVAMVPATAHYSWPKAGTLLGIGQNQIHKIHVEKSTLRMEISHLEEELRECLRDKTPVIAVVAKLGTTEESAVDNLERILEVRENFRNRGLNFAIHCDAAWGAYFRCMYDKDNGQDLVPPPEFPLNAYVTRQYNKLPEADSITVDPHKSGYAPYPAGALCYRNSALRNMVSLAAPVVLHGPNEPSVGVFGIEGSKPGAAAASVWLAHKAIPLSRQGYGKILGQCVWTSKRMYCRLRTMFHRSGDKNVQIAMVQRLPAERLGEPDHVIKWERDSIDWFADQTDEELLKNLNVQSNPDSKNWRRLFQELGSDQVILPFAFNFRESENHDWNQDADKLNDFNKKIFDFCSITVPNKPLKDVRLILTGSQFGKNSYGADFVNWFAGLLGVNDFKGDQLRFLLSTTMNPWITNYLQDPNSGRGFDYFLEEIEEALRSAVRDAASTMGVKVRP